MKLSTKGRYGLRAMLDLAVNSDAEHVSLFSIAKRQEISGKYLEQVFSALRNANLVKSVKGAQGGYVLANDPSSIKIGTILRVLEGNIDIVDMDPGFVSLAEDDISYCIRVGVWEKMNERINKLFDSTSLEDLVREHKKMNGSQESMYYI